MDLDEFAAFWGDFTRQMEAEHRQEFCPTGGRQPFCRQKNALSALHDDRATLRLVPGFRENLIQTAFYARDRPSQSLSALLFVSLCLYVWSGSLKR